MRAENARAFERLARAEARIAPTSFRATPSGPTTSRASAAASRPASATAVPSCGAAGLVLDPPDPQLRRVPRRVAAASEQLAERRAIELRADEPVLD